MTKIFESIEAVVAHYKSKVKMPSRLEVRAGSNIHTFTGRGHNHDKVLRRQFDSYQFNDQHLYSKEGIKLTLTVNFLRYYEEKRLVESYFKINANKVTYISPISIGDNLIEESEFERLLWKDAIDDYPNQWVDRNWINLFKDPFSFHDQREEAYKEARKNMEYVVHSIDSPFPFEELDLSPELSRKLVERKICELRKKWLLKEGETESIYFRDFEIPCGW